MICSKCGKTIPDGKLYCDLCGGSPQGASNVDELMKTLDLGPEKEKKGVSVNLIVIGLFVLVVSTAFLLIVGRKFAHPEKVAEVFMDALVNVNKAELETCLKFDLDDHSDLKDTLEYYREFLADGGSIQYEFDYFEVQAVHIDELSSTFDALRIDIDPKKVKDIGTMHATVTLTDSMLNEHEMELELKILKYKMNWYVYDFMITKF